MSTNAVRVGALLVSVLWAAACHAAEFVFERVEVDTQGPEILIDADVAYRLSDAALEALEHGVPLTFELHVQVRNADAWVWQSDVADSRLRSVLRYHPLSALYEVRNLQTGGVSSFATREAALRTLGRVRNLSVVRRDSLEPDAVYVLRLDAYLDVDALPLPLRPLAYISRSWALNSETWEWQLRP